MLSRTSSRAGNAVTGDGCRPLSPVSWLIEHRQNRRVDLLAKNNGDGSTKQKNPHKNGGRLNPIPYRSMKTM